MNPLDDDDELGYDADHSDPRQYCRHGTFVGSWWGPDYLCAACESGDDFDADELGLDPEEEYDA